MEKQKRKFKGIWIPAEIWLSSSITKTETLFLTEIDSLDVDGKGCFASNAYFAGFFKMAERQVRRYVSSLVEKKLILAENPNSKKRILRLTNPDRNVLVDPDINVHVTRTKMSANGRALPTNDNKEYNIASASPNALDKILEAKKNKEPSKWSSQELIGYINAMKSDHRKAVRVIGNYLLIKGVSLTNYQNREQLTFELKRNLRAANRLAKAFDEERINKVLEFLKDNATFTWTLETCEKYITVANLTPEILPRARQWQR